MFFILQAQKFFSDKLQITIPILLYVLYNIFYATLAIPFGKLSDKIGRKKIIASGYLLFSLTSLGFAFAQSIPILIILFAFYGITYAMVEGNQRACVSDLAPKYLKGTALGTFHTIIGIVMLASNLIAGVLWENFSAKLMFIFGSSASFVAAILLMLFLNQIRQK